MVLVLFSTTTDPGLDSPRSEDEEDLGEAPLACAHLLGWGLPRRNLGGKGEPWWPWACPGLLLVWLPVAYEPKTISSRLF